MSDGSFKIDDKYKPNAVYSENKLSHIDEKIEARLPLNAAYKSGIKFNAALVKQYKYLIDTYNHKENSDDVYMQYYGAFYKQLKEKKLLEPFVRLMLGSMKHDDNDKWLAKNTKNTIGF